MTTTTPTVTIHYQSPKSDEFKIPRPHRIQLVLDPSNGNVPLMSAVEGGELGPILGLAGFTKKTGRIDFKDPAKFLGVDEFLQLVGAAIAENDLDSIDGLKGWHPAFTDDRGPFTYSAKIRRVSISA